MRGNGVFIPKPANRRRSTAALNTPFRGNKNNSLNNNTKATGINASQLAGDSRPISQKLDSALEPSATDARSERSAFISQRSQVGQTPQPEPAKERSMRDTFIPTGSKAGTDLAKQTRNLDVKVERAATDRLSSGTDPTQTSSYAMSDASAKRMSMNDRDDTISSVSGYTNSTTTSQPKKRKCHICLQQLRSGSIACSTCSRRFHSRCLRIPESEIRPGWQCRRCVGKCVASTEQRTAEPSVAPASRKASADGNDRPAKRKKLGTSISVADLSNAASINLSASGPITVSQHASSAVKDFSREDPVARTTTGAQSINARVSHFDALSKSPKVPTTGEPTYQRPASDVSSATPHTQPASHTATLSKQARLQKHTLTELAPCKGCKRKTMPLLPSGKLLFCSACKKENKHKELASEGPSYDSRPAAQVVGRWTSMSTDNTETHRMAEVRSTNPEMQGHSNDNFIKEILPTKKAAIHSKTRRQDSDSEWSGLDESHDTLQSGTTDLDAPNAMDCSPDKASSPGLETQMKERNGADAVEAVKKQIDSDRQITHRATEANEDSSKYLTGLSEYDRNYGIIEGSGNKISQERQGNQSTSGTRLEAVADVPMSIQAENEASGSKLPTEGVRQEVQDGDEMDIDSAYDSFPRGTPVVPGWRDVRTPHRQPQPLRASKSTVSNVIDENDLRPSLYSEWPEYDPKNQFDRAEKIAEISRRPRRKSFFGEAALYSQTGKTDILAPRRSTKANTSQATPDSKGHDAFRNDGSPKVIEADGTIYEHYDDVEDFLGVRDEMILTIYQGKLRYRDARRDHSGNLSRQTVLHPTGI